MKEKILGVFKALGFVMENFEKFGYGFQYEGKPYLYMYDEDNENYLNISIPAVLDVDDDDDISFYQLMNYINITIKYVKASKLDDSIWLVYERRLLDEEDLEQVITHMIHLLEGSLHSLNRIMKGIKDDCNPDDDDDSETLGNNDQEDIA